MSTRIEFSDGAASAPAQPAEAVLPDQQPPMEEAPDQPRPEGTTALSFSSPELGNPGSNAERESASSEQASEASENSHGSEATSQSENQPLFYRNQQELEAAHAARKAARASRPSNRTSHSSTPHNAADAPEGNQQEAPEATSTANTESRDWFEAKSNGSVVTRPEGSTEALFYYGEDERQQALTAARRRHTRTGESQESAEQQGTAEGTAEQGTEPTSEAEAKAQQLRIRLQAFAAQVRAGREQGRAERAARNGGEDAANAAGESTTPDKDSAKNANDVALDKIMNMLGDTGGDAVSREKVVVAVAIAILMANGGDGENARNALNTYLESQGIDPDKQAKVDDELSSVMYGGLSDEEMDKALAMNKEFDEKVGPIQERYRVAFERYTQLSAEQRAEHVGERSTEHLDRLTAAGGIRNKFKGWLGKASNFIGKISHPIDTFIKAPKRDRARNEAKVQFLSIVRELAEEKAKFNGTWEYGDDGNKESFVVMSQLRELDMAEDRILAYQIGQTMSNTDPVTGEATFSKRDLAKNWLAQRWQKSGKFGRFATVALPAAAIGAGVSAAALFAPVWMIPAGFGLVASRGGREAAQRYAKMVNRRLVNTEQGEQRLRDAAAARRAEFTSRIDTHNLNARADSIDITEPIEAGTIGEYTTNNARYARAGQVGALAAAGAYGAVQAGRLIGWGNNGGGDAAANQANGGGNTPPASPYHDGMDYTTDLPPGTANAAPLPNISVDGLPWDVAHQAAEQGLIPHGSEMDVIRQFAETQHDHLGVNGSGFEAVENASNAAQDAPTQLAFNKSLLQAIANGTYKNG